MTRRVLVALALVALALVAGCRPRDVAPDARAELAPSGPQAARLLYPRAPASFVDLVEGARHGVVGLRATHDVKSGPAAMFPGAPETTADRALGTGFLIEARGVYILTNDHIAAAAPELVAVLDGGTEAPVKVIGRDPRLDLALLSIDVPRLTALPLGDSDALEVGEWIVVLGDPFGDEVTASAGIVSSNGHASASLVEDRAMTHRAYLQTDARIHRGNSGGPVLDTAGQVVGIAVATDDRPTELSFAIPIDRVKDIVGALRDHGQVARGWLGAVVRPVPTELAQKLGMSTPTGALVTEVRPGSPAARSALRAGDVLLRWDGRKVDARSLPWVVSASPVGKPTEIVVWRNGAEQRLAVFTERAPE